MVKKWKFKTFPRCHVPPCQQLTPSPLSSASEQRHRIPIRALARGKASVLALRIKRPGRIGNLSASIDAIPGAPVSHVTLLFFSVPNFSHTPAPPSAGLGTFYLIFIFAFVTFGVETPPISRRSWSGKEMYRCVHEYPYGCKHEYCFEGLRCIAKDAVASFTTGRSPVVVFFNIYIYAPKEQYYRLQGEYFFGGRYQVLIKSYMQVWCAVPCPPSVSL